MPSCCLQDEARIVVERDGEPGLSSEALIPTKEMAGATPGPGTALGGPTGQVARARAAEETGKAAPPSSNNGVGSVNAGTGAPAPSLRVLLSSSIDATSWPSSSRCYISSLYKAEFDLAEAVAERASRAFECEAWVQYQSTFLDGGKQQQQLLERQAAEGEEGDGSGEEAADGLLSLTRQQRAAVDVASLAPLMLLTGDAGCGKTLTTRTIVQQWIEDGKRVAICAPTGEILSGRRAGDAHVSAIGTCGIMPA